MFLIYFINFFSTCILISIIILTISQNTIQIIIIIMLRWNRRWRLIRSYRWLFLRISVIILKFIFLRPEINLCKRNYGNLWILNIILIIAIIYRNIFQFLHLVFCEMWNRCYFIKIKLKSSFYDFIIFIFFSSFFFFKEFFFYHLINLQTQNDKHAENYNHIKK